MVNTPVLFETFVRVDYARQVWEAIKAAQPKILYFYSNKGRAEKEGEIERNNEIRSWVKEIDWDCDLHTFFRDECVDVYTSLRGAISWLFENEETGIILEDDCVPTPAFFSFCDQMLEKYRDDMRVWYISGDNFLNNNPSGKDYLFSHNHWLYGWASWRSRWEQVPWGNAPFDLLLSSDFYKDFFKTKDQIVFRNKEILRVKDFVNRTNCWDFLFGMIADLKGAMRVVPREHLVTNIGMQGEHSAVAIKTIFSTQAQPSYAHYDLQNEPDVVDVDKEYDYLFYKKFSHYMRFYNRVFRRVIGVIYKKLNTICKR